MVRSKWTHLTQLIRINITRGGSRDCGMMGFFSTLFYSFVLFSAVSVDHNQPGGIKKDNVFIVILANAIYRTRTNVQRQSTN